MSVLVLVALAVSAALLVHSGDLGLARGMPVGAGRRALPVIGSIAVLVTLEPVATGRLHGAVSNGRS
ncbi:MULTISPECIES: hypothetical protein [unclassified Spirillospora]|uniref:hypothetical protein n=1 Tax=unclassified Spirillospora TaxID=2642701 RepID=UPI00371D772C